VDADYRLILEALSGDAQPEALELAVPLLDNSAVHAEAVKAQHPKAAQEALNRLQAKP
jgi:hypothetical protein